VTSPGKDAPADEGAGPAGARPLALVGLRASGKSTVGRALAERLGRPYIDLDDSLPSRQISPLRFAEPSAYVSVFRNCGAYSPCVGVLPDEIRARPASAVIDVG